MISVAPKTPLEIRLEICIYKTSLLHRPDDYIGFTLSCPPHILQQNCAHDCDGSITIMWNLNVFINDFPLPCRQVKNQFFQDIRLRPAVHKLSFSTFT